MTQTIDLRVFLLGPMRIEHNNNPIRLPRRKVESLLAYLILHPEQQARDQLATLFWGDSTDAQARHSLRTALATVRQEISPDLLLTDRDHVQLNADYPLWTDLHEVLRLESMPNDANHAFVQPKVVLWQGELLTGFYDEWIFSEREYYRTRLLTLFLQVAHNLRARSEYAQAIAVAQQVLSFDPANELAHQHLMFCYVSSGDRPAALRQYDACVRALEEDVDAPPSPETVALYEWIRQNSGEAGSTAAKITNLPIPLTSFVGRTRESAEVKQLLRGAVRLVTLLGAGGNGKTRLAIQVATDLIDSFDHGVWWVELAALSDDALVARAVAKTLGVRETSEQPLSETIASFIDDKQMLLIIDNCEHLVAPSAELAATLLAQCPHLQMLTTSREALNIAGETLWQVPTFAAPDPTKLDVVELLLQFESVRLFIERAAAVQPGFALTLENAQAVAEICQRLDGIPLAIELAAARVKVIGVKQIAAYLNSALGARFSLLTEGKRGVLPRHQTLRAAIDWSYDLLEDGERLLFRQAAVFRGSFTLEALEAIVDVGLNGLQQPFPAILNLLTQLVDKSLVIVEEHGGQSRYHLLETMREYAAEQLRASGEEALWRARHAAWYLELAKRAASKLEGAEQPYWFALLEGEHDNLRAALHWYGAEVGGATSGLQLSCAIALFWCIRNYLSEGQQWIERFLRQLDPTTEPHLQVDAINFLARIVLLQSNFQAARLYYERSLTLGRQIEYDQGVVTAMIGLGGVLWELGEFQKARASLEEAVRFARSMQHLRDLGRALNNLGLVSMHQGDHQTARAALNECLLIYQQIGSKTGTATALFNLGMLAGHDGDFVRARGLYEESLAIDRELGNRTTTADSLNNMGGLAIDQGDLVAATAYFEEAAQIYREIGAIGDTAYTSTGLGDIAFYEGDYSTARVRYMEALPLFRKASNQRLIGRVLGQLGRIACREGDLVTAATLCGEALTIRLTIGHKPGMIFVLDQGFLELALATGQPLIAARILGAVASARIAIARPRDPMETRQLESFLMQLREQLGDGEMASAWAAGEMMGLEEVATYTLNTLAMPPDRLLHPENET